MLLYLALRDTQIWPVSAFPNSDASCCVLLLLLLLLLVLLGSNLDDLLTFFRLFHLFWLLTFQSLWLALSWFHLRRFCYLYLSLKVVVCADTLWVFVCYFGSNNNNICNSLSCPRSGFEICLILYLSFPLEVDFKLSCKSSHLNVSY